VPTEVPRRKPRAEGSRRNVVRPKELSKLKSLEDEYN
jgi:hypothetical protein